VRRKLFSAKRNNFLLIENIQSTFTFISPENEKLVLIPRLIVVVQPKAIEKAGKSVS